MELASNNIGKTNKNVLDQEDANSSTVLRKRRKMVIFIFTFFFIFLALIIGALFFYLLRDATPDYNQNDDSITRNPAIQTFYTYSDCYATESSLDAFNRIVRNKSITNPNQIFTLAFQTAAEHLENITTSVISDAKNTEFASTNCSNSLSHALGQIRGGLEIMRVNPFVEKLSDDRWNEMMDRIIAASVNMRYCLGDLEKVVESTAVIEVREKVHEVQVYVSSSEQFLRNYKGETHERDILQNSWWIEKDNVDWGRVIPENLFIICVSGLFLLFIFFLFWTLCTTR